MNDFYHKWPSQPIKIWSRSPDEEQERTLYQSPTFFGVSSVQAWFGLGCGL